MGEIRGRPFGGLTDDELYCSAASAEEAGDSDMALLLFEALMRREGKPGRGQFAVGRLLLERQHADGIRLIDEVMKTMPRTIIPGCELIIRFLLASGRESEARSYIRRYCEQQEIEHG